MRVFVLLLLLSSFAYGDVCKQNVTNVDMCEHAQRIAVELNKGLPSKSGSSSIIENAVTLHNVVVFNIRMNFTKEELAARAESNGITLEAMKANWRKIVADSIELTGCGEEMFKAFVYLGGSYRYHYVYQDGSTFEIIEQQSCPSDE